MNQVKVNSQDVANIQLSTLGKIIHYLKEFKLQKFFNPFCFFYDFKLLSVFTDYMYKAVGKKLELLLHYFVPIPIICKQAYTNYSTRPPPKKYFFWHSISTTLLKELQFL